MSDKLTIGERPNKKNIESLDLTRKVNIFSKNLILYFSNTIKIEYLKQLDINLFCIGNLNKKQGQKVVNKNVG